MFEHVFVESIEIVIWGSWWVRRVMNNPNVTVHFNTETVDIEADDKGQMGGLRLRDIVTGEERSLKVRGLFYGIGHSPNSQLLEGQVELDDASYVVVEPGTANTSVEGVFAAGDLQVCNTILALLEHLFGRKLDVFVS